MHALCDEIGMFVSSLFLKVLDSPSAGHSKWMLVVECLCALCSDAQSAIGVFLSYDCDLEADDLFCSVVNALAQVATGRTVKSADCPKPGGKLAREGETLRLAALEVLVGVLRSVLMAQGLPAGEETGFHRSTRNPLQNRTGSDA